MEKKNKSDDRGVYKTMRSVARHYSLWNEGDFSSCGKGTRRKSSGQGR